MFICLLPDIPSVMQIPRAVSLAMVPSIVLSEADAAPVDVPWYYPSLMGLMSVLADSGIGSLAARDTFAPESTVLSDLQNWEVRARWDGIPFQPPPAIDAFDWKVQFGLTSPPDDADVWSIVTALEINTGRSLG